MSTRSMIMSIGLVLCVMAIAMLIPTLTGSLTFLPWFVYLIALAIGAVMYFVGKKMND